MLTEDRVRELLQLYDHGCEIPELAARYEVSSSTVSRVLTGKTYGEITGGRNVSRKGHVTRYRCAHIETRLDQGCRNLTLIGAELGISRQAVAKLIKNKGLGGH